MTNGFTVNFFKTFWNKIGHFVVRAINYAFVNNTFSRNQKMGIITCIPKENKAKHFLKNWRPITLLNVVYKLASGSIANRMKGVLDILISKDQTGFVKNRYIGENTRLLYDIMKFTEDNNMPGLVMMIDFEKAFDTLSFTFIEKCLKLFNFGPMFRKWISLFLYNTETCVILNGFLSNFFKIERGCRQGDPISAYIFILCAEILAIKIKQNKDVKGIIIDGEEYKISQFADDTSLLLDGSEKSLNAVLKILHTFSEISGLKINFEKTKLIWIGSLKYSTRAIKTKWKLSWGDTQFKLLGLIFDVDLEKMIELNFNEKLKKVKNSLSHWKKRILTPIGRITVVKSILIPLFIHCFTSLPMPNNSFLKTLNDLLYDFIWDGKTKIKRTIVIKTYKEGGLNMIDIYSYIYCLKIKWLKKFVNNSDGKCYKLIYSLFDIDKLFNTGKLFCDFVINKLRNAFWIDVLKAYSIFIDKLCINSAEQLLQMPLFYNQKLMMGNKHYFIKNMYDKGFRYVQDILNQQGEFLELTYLEQVIGKPINFLQYHSLKQAIRKYIDNLNISIHSDLLNVQYPIINCYIKPIIVICNRQKYIYETFITNSDIPTCQAKWNLYFENFDINWHYIYSYVFHCTKDSYIQWFQTRIIHRILATNSLLFKMKIVDDKMCTFCKCQEETLTHLFWECSKIQSLFEYLKDNIQNFDNFFCCKSFILGSETNDYKYDILFLELKRYIYLTRRKNILPSIVGFKRSLKLAWDIFQNTNMLEKEKERWLIVRSLLD